MLQDPATVPEWYAIATPEQRRASARKTARTVEEKLELVAAAKLRCETLYTDADIFDVWASFVASGERLSCFQPALPPDPTPVEQQRATQGVQLIREGKDLIFYITRARVPMPKSTGEFIERCARFWKAWAPAPQHRAETRHRGAGVS